MSASNARLVVVRMADPETIREEFQRLKQTLATESIEGTTSLRMYDESGRQLADLTYTPRSAASQNTPDRSPDPGPVSDIPLTGVESVGVTYDIVHQVQPGEGVGSVIANHGIRYERFMHLNPDKNPQAGGRDVLFSGERILVHRATLAAVHTSPVIIQRMISEDVLMCPHCIVNAITKPL